MSNFMLSTYWATVSFLFQRFKFTFMYNVLETFYALTSKKRAYIDVKCLVLINIVLTTESVTYYFGLSTTLLVLC